MTHVSPLKELPSETVFGHLKKLIFFLDFLSWKQEQNDVPLKVMDFGCGNGESIGQYVARTGCEYYGIDFHKESLRHAENLMAGLNVHFLEALPEELQLDVILYGDVLEHLEDPEAILQQHLKHLKQGGLVLIAVPNGHGPFEIESSLDRKFGLTHKFQKIRHYYYSMRHIIAVWVKKHILQKNIVAAPPLSEPIPYNIESGHIQFFKWDDVQRMLNHCGLKLLQFNKGVLIGGPFSGSIFGGCDTFLYLNAKLGDVFPRRMVSSWYFAAEKIKN